METLKIPRNESELIVNEGLTFTFQKPMPNWWHRFWYWVLLGWKWRKV
jgi:hypothetical protein